MEARLGVVTPQVLNAQDIARPMRYMNKRSQTDAWNSLKKRRGHNCRRRIWEVMPQLSNALDLARPTMHMNIRSQTNAWNILQKRRVHLYRRRCVSEHPFNFGWWRCHDKECAWMLGPLDCMSDDEEERMCSNCGTTR